MELLLSKASGPLGSREEKLILAMLRKVRLSDLSREEIEEYSVLLRNDMFERTVPPDKT